MRAPKPTLPTTIQALQITSRLEEGMQAGVNGDEVVVKSLRDHVLAQSLLLSMALVFADTPCQSDTMPFWPRWTRLESKLTIETAVYHLQLPFES